MALDMNSVGILVISGDLGSQKSEPPKRGRKDGAARKMSKNFLTLFDDFWRFFALRGKCRKVSKNFLTLFDDF